MTDTSDATHDKLQALISMDCEDVDDGPSAGYCTTCRIWFAALTGADRSVAERIREVRPTATKRRPNGWRQPCPPLHGALSRSMARTSARNVRPSLSNDPRDKLLAALNWSHGKLKHGAAYGIAPMYFDARTRAPVETIAASLPSAPRCPL
jgi:hypothetical protein